MKIEKIELQSAERNWEMADIRDKMNEIIDALQPLLDNYFTNEDRKVEDEKCGQMVFGRKLTEGGGYPCSSPKGNCPAHEKKFCQHGLDVHNCGDCYGYAYSKSPQPVSAVCEHESDGLSYTSNPPQWKCKKCGKFSSQIENSPKFVKIGKDDFKDLKFEVKVEPVVHEEDTVEEWEKDFLATFYVYNLKRGSPAGAHEEALVFIRKLLARAKSEDREKMRNKILSLQVEKCTSCRAMLELLRDLE